MCNIGGVDVAGQRLLTLQQPMARDLRAIMTAIRLNWDLERAGDLVEVSVHVPDGTRGLTSGCGPMEKGVFVRGTAPDVIAHVVKPLVVGRDPGIDMSPFRIERFG